MTHMIEIDGDGIMRQGHETADLYLMKAIEDIDKWLGEGAAKKYPQIVAAYMQAAATDAAGTIIAQQLRAGLDEVAESISAIKNELELSSGLDGIAEAIADAGLSSGLGVIAEAITDAGSTDIRHSIDGIATSLQNISEMLDLHSCGRPFKTDQ